MTLVRLLKISLLLSIIPHIITASQSPLLVPEMATEKQDLDFRGEYLIGLGLTEYDIANYSKAIEYWEKAHQQFRQSGDRKGIAKSLNVLGRGYFGLTKYPQAIELFRTALQINTAINDLEGGIESRVDLGKVFYTLGQYEEAIQCFQQAWTIKQQHNLTGKPDPFRDLSSLFAEPRRILDKHDSGTESLLYLGLAYQKLDQHDNAIDLLQEALIYTTKIKDKDGHANVLNALGYSYLQQDQFLKAREVFQQAFIYSRETAYSIEGTGYALIGQGNVDFALEQYEQAISGWWKAVAYIRDVQDLAGEALIFRNIATALEAKGEPELAIAYFKKAINIREGIRHDIRALSREEQHSYKQTIADSYQSLAELLLAQGRVMEALLTLDLLKVQELQDFFKDVPDNQETAQEIELLPQEQEIFAEVDNIHLDLSTAVQSPLIRTQVQQLRQTAAKQNLGLTTYQDLQRRLSALGGNSALFYPLVLDQALALVIFTQDAAPIYHRVPINKTKVQKVVAEFRTQIKEKSSVIRETAQELYKWLIEPIAIDLKNASIKTLIYAPDGQMRYVPLSALYDGQKWLIETFQVNYITTLNLTNLETQSFQNPSIIAGAFTDQKRQIKVADRLFTFNSIPAAHKEVETLSQTFSKTTTLTGKNFTRKNVTTAQLNRHNIVHLATHGQLVSGNPEESFILLNHGEHITLRELKDWQLPNVGVSGVECLSDSPR